MTATSVSSERASPPPGVRSTRITFRAFSGAEELPKVEADWGRVLAGVGHRRFAHFFPWYEAYARCFSEDPRSLRVFVAYAGDAPIAVFPLVRRARRVGGVPVRALEVPSNPHLLICDLVFDRSPANAGLVAAFADHLRKEAPEAWDALVLPNLLEDSAGWFSLRAVPPPRLVTEEADRCEYLPCIPFEERFASLSGNFRSVVRRARKRLAEEPDVQFVRARTPAEIEAAFGEFLAVEGSGWKGEKGSAIRCDERRTAFYRNVATRFAALGCAEINLLKTAGKSIAGQFCLDVDRCLYVLKLGYDEAYAKAAPGHMLLEHVLQRCEAERDIDSVNLVSDAAWFGQWKAASYSRYSAFVFNASARGLAGYWSLRSKQLLRPAVRRIRKALAGAAGEKKD